MYPVIHWSSEKYLQIAFDIFQSSMKKITTILKEAIQI